MLNWLKVWWLQLRYNLESSAGVSRGLAGALGRAKIRSAEWKAAKPVYGYYGKTVADARLNALRFWLRKHGDTKSRMPVFRLDTKQFTSPTNPRLWYWKVVLRFALLTGHPVVLIGACRTGKTLLLNKLTPGKVIDKVADSRRGGGECPLVKTEMPDGIYSIDECQVIEGQSILQLMSIMAAQKRSFCLSTQRYRDVREVVDAYRSEENAKRVVLVVVGGQSNPTTFLRELPQ